MAGTPAAGHANCATRERLSVGSCRARETAGALRMADRGSGRTGGPAGSGGDGTGGSLGADVVDLLLPPIAIGPAGADSGPLPRILRRRPQRFLSRFRISVDRSPGSGCGPVLSGPVESSFAGSCGGDPYAAARSGYRFRSGGLRKRSSGLAGDFALHSFTDIPDLPIRS